MKILIAEDDGVSMLILKSAVERLGHTAICAKEGLSAHEAHAQQAPDVVISDWLMPGVDGIELCRRIRRQEGHAGSAYTYFIFMTALDGKHHFLEGMQAGADDYLTKPIDMDELAARLFAAARVTSLHRTLHEQNAELERRRKESHEAARTDALTAIGNRLRLREDLAILKARVDRYHHRYAAALCDIDEFKRYNDHHGHLAGDDALLRVAETLSRGVRAGDAVYRYGGEEFLVILAEQPEKAAAIAMERIRRSVELLGIPHHGKDPPGPVTLSVGIAEMNADDQEPWEAWLKRADDALYQAKAQGRNRVVCAGDPEGGMGAQPGLPGGAPIVDRE
jgi:two-component system, cell cycle response regulator